MDNFVLSNVVRDKTNHIIAERELTILSNKKLIESIDCTALGISSDSESKKFKDVFLKENVYDRVESYTYTQFNNSIERPFENPAYLVGTANSKTSYLHEK